MEGVRGAVLVAAVLWAQGARGAFIDNRPVMPRVLCAHYTKGDSGGAKVEQCTGQGEQEQEGGEHTPIDFFCQTTWTNATSPGSDHSSMLNVLKQGCLPVYSGHESESAQHKQCRNKTLCVSESQVGEGKGNNKDVHFCCCHGDTCNTQFSWEPAAPAPPPPPVETPPPPHTWFLLLYTLVPLLVIAVIAAAGCYVYRQRKHARFSSLSSLGEDTAASPPTPTLSSAQLRPVELLEIKARGRFGAVWKGQVGKDMVAVKIFPLQDKQSWFAEQEIYNLPQMNHEHILQFLGVDRRGEGLQVEFWLVSSFHEYGSLCDFLKNHVLGLPDLIKICLTMAKGLAHLHGEVAANKGAGLKPAIAHRDFKSKNVLIKADMTACIGDFGLALQFRPNEVVGDTHGQVGTRRYMAPEVLEGAINFSRDAFLRIDMYACGLVLWEVASRYSPSGEVGAYKLPFEAEASPHPSLEEICDLVVTKKVRPELRSSWRNQPGLAILCETVEECWDHDAEARLSSSCVVERLHQLRLHTTATAAGPTLPIQTPFPSGPGVELVPLLPMTQTSTDVTYEGSSST